jgi:glycosyltransferase involved in cell wall biosynthesis
VYYAADIWTDALNALSVPRPIKVVMRLVEGHVLRGATGIVAVSVEVAERVATFGVDSARIVVANNGVDTQVFTSVGPGLDHAGPVFVYTGTMSEWQGAVVFIEALARVSVGHPAVQLHFFGQGADESALRAAATRLGMDNVHFEGIVSPEVAATWLRSATAALASIKPGQGYDFAKPTKIYAAAACGTPVIFAGAGAGAVVVRDNALGWGTAYSIDDVVAAMEQAISEQASGRSRELRDGRAQWAVSNASLLATGKAAAQAVLWSARR